VNIAVLVTQVIDVTFYFDLHPESHTPRQEDVFHIVNPADLAAAEWALNIRERLGCQLTFISLGPERAGRALVDALAMGGGRAIHVHEERTDRISLAAAHLLADVLRPLACDIILCGSHSVEDGSGETPPALAELLDLPQVTSVVALEVASEGDCAIAERKLDRGRRQTVACPLPAVFSVDPCIAIPRYAPFPFFWEAHTGKNILRLDCPTRSIDPAVLDGIESLRTLVGYSLPRPRPKKTFTIDPSLSADERMDLIMSGGLTQRKEHRVLEGDPGKIAHELARILGNNLRMSCRRG